MTLKERIEQSERKLGIIPNPDLPLETRVTICEEEAERARQILLLKLYGRFQ